MNEWSIWIKSYEDIKNNEYSRWLIWQLSSLSILFTHWFINWIQLSINSMNQEIELYEHVLNHHIILSISHSIYWIIIYTLIEFIW